MDTVRSHLISVRPEMRVAVSTAHVRTLVDGLATLTPLSEVLAGELFNGWSELDAVDVVETLGKFLARSAKSRFRGEVHSSDENVALVPLTTEQLRVKWSAVQSAYANVKECEAAVKQAGKTPAACGPSKSKTSRKASAQDALFASVPERKKVKTALERAEEQLRKAKFRLAKAGRELMPYAGEDGLAFIAEGWRPSDLGRNITQSVATCVISEISEETLDRFVTRTYAPRPATLAEDHVLLLVWLAKNNLLNKLSELTHEQYEVVQVLTQAWDLIEVYCDDARSAVASLVDQANSDSVDVDVVRQAVQRSQWLNPAELARIHSAIPSSEGSTAILTRRLRVFAAVVSENPAWLNPTGPYDISTAQAQALCHFAGLVSDAEEEAEITREIRARLSEMGLKSDLDREVGEGVRAWKSGLLDEFYLNRADRASGDPDWSRRWQEVLATA